MTSCEFRFDNMEYDTSRAQEFLKEHAQFSGFTCSDSDKFVHDSVGNKICLSTLSAVIYHQNTTKLHTKIDDIKKKLLQLSDLIDKNAELFCQLEYMIRKIKPTELKAYDLKLITQNLRYCASNECKKNLKNGCYAVVTAKSDIESAVDVLIETPDRFPWNLKYIYVEESVAQRFQTILEDKVRRSETSHADNANKEKTFIFEYAGKMEPAGTNAVIVEAYRSVKELFSLLSPTPYCLSLWCESITESLEISSKVHSNIVWVNGYGLFEGPPETSQSFFSIMDIACAEIRPGLEVLDSWQEMSTSERACKLEAFDQVSETEGSFYCVREKYTCAGTREPVKVLVGSDAENVFESSNTFKSDLLKIVAKGGGVNLLCDVTQMQEVQQLCDKLNSVGAPIMSCTIRTPDFSDIIYSRKVVWTSYGTIFSN